MYYFVAQILINDDEEYEKYLKDTDEVFNKFEGKYLAILKYRLKAAKCDTLLVKGLI